MPDKTVTIDAKGKSPGRVATEVVKTLTGKDDPSWRPNVLPDRRVIVLNAGRLKLSQTKQRSKVYYRHSGYPGAIKAETLGHLFARRPEEVVRRAVYGMLPKNKLRAKALKKLTIKTGE